ncbi:unnamed protein product [Fusarium venenatum]|uniref:Uncharacterized protein n=1 Tax=Fusarium venenatum TaxID=56646 RepID=A0A2L2T301_9HYPO|nr:uncharacterized protein FVRRES_01576 [Fusarium venenatum]CEI65064.1 unnamed protein product [Fusarium venenatum]
MIHVQGDEVELKLSAEYTLKPFRPKISSGLFVRQKRTHWNLTLELMSIYPREYSQSPERISSHHVSFVRLSGDLFELLPASGSAWVMSGFMHQMHSITNLSSTTTFDRQELTFWMVPDVAANNTHRAFSPDISVASARGLYHIWLFSCVVSPSTTFSRPEFICYCFNMRVPGYIGREVHWGKSRLYHAGSCIVVNMRVDACKCGMPSYPA